MLKGKMISLSAVFVSFAAICFAQSTPVCPLKGTVTLNFDAAPLSAGVEVDATGYLSSFGITLSRVTPGSFIWIIGQGSPGLQIATSAPNFFTQFNGNNPETMTMNFCAPLTNISFSRTGLTADSKPGWTAEALDVQGTVLSRVGEPLTATGIPIPPQKFTLSGRNIAALRISSNNGGFTNLSGVPIDDLTLTAERRETVFLIHGIAQSGGINGGMAALATSLQDSTFGIDQSRFLVDDGFDYGYCTATASCDPINCTIQNGARALATYINNQNPSGDIILVGYSLGGLIARDMILNNYNNVLTSNRKVGALITLGTPNLGYPYLSTDNAARCAPLAQEMAGDFRSPSSAGRINFQDQNGGFVAALSPYLWNLNTNWPSASFLPRTWSAIAGIFCDDPIRHLSKKPHIGCSDVDPDNDGVVCEQSATYATSVGGTLNPLPSGPNRRLSDPLYAHTDSVGSFFVFCGNTQGLFSLFDPALGGGVLAEIQTVINGLP